MANLKIIDLKNYLKSKSNKELINEISEIVKLFPNVKEYYATKSDPGLENETLRDGV